MYGVLYGACMVHLEDFVRWKWFAVYHVRVRFFALYRECTQYFFNAIDQVQAVTIAIV